jgi:threonine dehydrogenase-like Zn-dependent dehydrogenase
MVVSRNYVPQDFRDAMQLIKSEQIDLAPLVTGNYSLEEFPKAIHALQTQPEAHIKILIHPQKGNP